VEVQMELSRADLQTMDQLVSTWTGSPTTAVACAWLSVPLTLLIHTLCTGTPAVFSAFIAPSAVRSVGQCTAM
jgi:hypothetical protein